MPTIQFSNGHTVQFSAMPTQQQLDDFGKQQGWVQPQPQSQSPFNPHSQNSQFTQPTPAGATQMKYAPGSGTSTGSQFLGSLGEGAKQTGQSLVNPIVGGAKEVAKDTSQAFSGGVNQIKEGAGDINQGKNPFEATLKMGAGAVGAAFSPLATPFQPVNNAVNAVADKISNNPTVQKFANSKAGQVTSRVAEDVGNLSTVAQGVGGFMGSPELAAKGEGAINTIGEAAKPGMKAVGQNIAKGAKAVDALPGKVAQGLENKYVAQAKAEWAKPTTVTKPAYNKATEIFKNAQAKGHDIANTLVNNKINLKEHIDNGSYATADTAEKIRTDAVKASNEMLRPSLQKADAAGAPKTAVQDVINAARKNVEKNKSLTQETKDSLQAQLNKTELSLTKQYKEGMSLENLHDEKIVRDMNSKYDNVTNNPATNAEAVKNKAIADAARKTLETKAPKDIPVEAFNKELTKQHQAANYLDALNSKKVPVSLKGKIANATAKVTGAAVGHGLGGGILGGVGGYHIGGMLESMVANMSNPVKSSFLKNLETVNPEAFTKVQDYLNKPAPQLSTPNVGLSIKNVAKPASLKYLGKEKPIPESMVKVNNYKNPYPKLIKSPKK